MYTSGYTKVLQQAELLKQGLEEEAIPGFEKELSCIKHLLLSRYKGISTALPEAMLLRHLDAVLNDVDLALTGTSHTEPGKTTSIAGLLEDCIGNEKTGFPRFLLIDIFHEEPKLKYKRRIHYVKETKGRTYLPCHVRFGQTGILDRR